MHPVEFSLLDEVEESVELFPESGVSFIQTEQASPALRYGRRIVHGETIAVELDRQNDSLRIGVPAGWSTRARRIPLLVAAIFV